MGKLYRAKAVLLAGTAALVLAGCEPGQFGFPTKGAEADAAAATANAGTIKLIERDVEAPDVYQTTDKSLWDGRPSLGGVWVAAPGVKDPERVIIRNPSNGKFVIGALFKRERTNPGPPLQMSSDAAAALGILAGAPTEVQVTALRREEVPDPAAAPSVTPIAPAAPAPNAEIEATSLDPIAAAGAAIDRAETQPAPAAATPTPAPAPAAAPARAASGLAKPFVQIGIFSIEQNARNTATALRGAGIVPTVLEQESSGRKFWRVVVGPVQTSSERATILRTIKGLGFSDAYAVTN